MFHDRATSVKRDRAQLRVLTETQEKRVAQTAVRGDAHRWEELRYIRNTVNLTLKRIERCQAHSVITCRGGLGAHDSRVPLQGPQQTQVHEADVKCF